MGADHMETNDFIANLDEMTSQEVRDNFFDLFNTAFAIE
jgi:hypothetical protein